MKALLVIVCLILVAGAAFGGYVYGKEAGKHETNEKLQPEITAAKASADTAWDLYGDLSKSNEKLVEDYNKLYDAAVKYVNTSQYTPRQTLNCNSYSYGMNSVSTTCY